MAKDLSISILLDFYGDMLTEKQREVIELYYNADLSLAEISGLSGTRQGVRDSIKRAEAQLLEYEERLGLAKRFREIEAGLREIIEAAQDIDLYESRFSTNGEAVRKARRIIEIATSLSE